MNDVTDPGAHVPASDANAPGSDRPESLAWSANPGQIVHLPIYLVVIMVAAIPAILAPWPLLLAAFVPLAVGAWFVISVHGIRYELTDQRLRRTSGVLTRHEEEIELYRVDDTSSTAPLLYRLYGRGNVEVLSTDLTAPRFTLRAIEDPENVRRLIRERVEAMRVARGTRVIDTSVNL